MEWWNVLMAIAAVCLSALLRRIRRGEERMLQEHARFVGRYYIRNEVPNHDRIFGLWFSITVALFSIGHIQFPINRAAWIHLGSAVICGCVAGYWFRQPKRRIEWKWKSITG